MQKALNGYVIQYADLQRLDLLIEGFLDRALNMLNGLEGKEVIGGFGWCESNDAERFAKLVKQIIAQPQADSKVSDQTAYHYLTEYYTKETAYRTIIQSVK